MKKNTAIGLTIVVTFSIAVVWVSLKALSFFGNASDNIKAASITAVITMLTFVIGRYFEGRRVSREKINLEKTRIYEKFFDIYFTIFDPKRTPTDEPDEKLVENLRSFQKDLILWGSDSVIREFYRFRKALDAFSVSVELNAADMSVPMVEYLRAAGSLLRAMRRDVGHSLTSIDDEVFASAILKTDDPDVVTVLNLLRK